MADLSGHLAKLRRADEHRQVFDRMLSRLLDDGTYGITVHYDPDTGWNEVHWAVQREFPHEDFALVFGDILGNLRASLDYLVWQLVCVNGQTPSYRNQFPVAKRKGDWLRAMERGWLCGVADHWVKEIKALQPYHRGDQAKVDPLAILDHVNNLNKHRFLPITVVGLHEWIPRLNLHRVAAGEEITFDLVGGDKPVEHGAPLLRFRAASGAQIDVDDDHKPSVRVSFRDGLDHDWYTVELIEWVRDSLTRFEPAFSS